MRPLATFSVRTQFENVGDAWIYRELIRLVAQRAETLVDLSRCPPHFVRSLAVGTYSAAEVTMQPLRLLLRLIASRARGRPTYFFLNPGAKAGELDVKKLAGGWLLTILYLLLRVIGIRLCSVGVSFDNMGPRHARLWAFRSRLMHAQLVRDQGSADHATSLGIRIHGVMPDLSLATNTPLTPRTTPGIIALSFRVDQHEDHLRRVLERASDLIKTLHDQDVRWRLVCQVERDEPGMRTLEAALQPLAPEVELMVVPHDLVTAQAAYKGCRYVLSNRLHALLLGASMGAVPLAWIDPVLNVKVTRSFGELGMWDRVHDLGDPTSVEAIAQTVRSEDLRPLDLDPVRARLATVFDNLLGTIP